MLIHQNKIFFVDLIDLKLINKNITLTEATNVIKYMKDSAPGETGITLGFYKKYFQYFGEHYIEILNNKLQLPQTFLISKVKLIPKNNKTNKTINDLRKCSRESRAVHQTKYIIMSICLWNCNYLFKDSIFQLLR